MKFSELKFDFEAYEESCKWAKELRQAPPHFDIKDRQRVNLSNHAQSILLNDIDAFHHRLNIAPGAWKVGPEIINYIFRAYRAEANASIFQACNRQSKLLRETLTGLDSSTLSHVIATMINRYRAELRTNIGYNLEQKGASYSIRIDRENLCYLGSSDHIGSMEADPVYQDKIGLYLKAVIEEYCRKPHFDREAIFCKKDIDTIQEAIREQRMIQIVTKGTNLIYIKPYAIQADSERMYHYLCGYLFNNNDGSWNPGSVRLSQITESTILYHSGAITPEEAAALKTAIQKKGVQYLSNDSDSERPQKVVVRFTENGRKMYHQMLHLRPMYDGVPKGMEYTFTTTLRQAENYFFKFGHNVKILEPTVLAEKFSRRYESAARQYR